MIKVEYIILTGGTGGHVIPAVNFANYLIKNDRKCILILDKRGDLYAKNFLGKKIIINSDYFSKNILKSLKASFFLFTSFFYTLFLFLSIKPQKCLSFGSYSTFSPLLAALILKLFFKTKIYLHEQNSFIGKVNNFFVPFVDKIFLNYENTLNFKKKYYSKSILSGMPNIYNKKNIRDIYVKNKQISIFISGGSQGAINMNKLLLNIIIKLPQNITDKLNLTIQSSLNEKENLQKIIKNYIKNYSIEPFFNNYIEKLISSDLLISRSGAGTVNDVIISRTPSLFIPYPYSTRNHQTHNARYLVDKSAALIIEQKNLSNDESFDQIYNFISNFEMRYKIFCKLKNIQLQNANEIIISNIK
ncbi:MAG: UDP-N-acetylglucosamine--N-acetylmuramyl-(pentapeptide) pyrophosphoryl-undecaprenol N-acetylglucosamine transferase [Alphaproteobacteria bacterium MarineAlpha5_Bin9]|nr:MAG: UDP-N-acetylglucosamine--N-acetylmuramyl-(pentapeptide) pyrophosphoryl-undecaprenol N-acetylglucosamine transferase [Alphaproteobacteria bacterium MarineAlpha5_Bin9]